MFLFQFEPHVNEIAAEKSLRIIAAAQDKYRDEFPNAGYACSLAALGGNPPSGPPSPQSAGIIKADLASGVRRDYFFEIRGCKRETILGVERVTHYRVVALPLDQGKSGVRGFCSDESGKLKMDPEGGENCTQDIQ